MSVKLPRRVLGRVKLLAAIGGQTLAEFLGDAAEAWIARICTRDGWKIVTEGERLRVRPRGSHVDEVGAVGAVGAAESVDEGAPEGQGVPVGRAEAAPPTPGASRTAASSNGTGHRPPGQNPSPAESAAHGQYIREHLDEKGTVLAATLGLSESAVSAWKRKIRAEGQARPPFIGDIEE